MILRQAKYSDIAECLDIGERFWATTPYANDIPYSQVGVLGLLTGLVQSHMMLVVETEDKIVGVAAAIVTPFHFNPDIKVGAELFWYVDPDYREDGTGEYMLDALEELARDNGATIWSMGSFGHKGGDKMLTRKGYTQTEKTYSKVL